jgi:hypothetical protein
LLLLLLPLLLCHFCASYLDLGGNLLNGTIPAAISNLTSLSYVHQVSQALPL